MPDFTAVVPLDGTSLSESALALLPFAREIGVSKVLLLSVWDTDGEEPDSPKMRDVVDRGRAFLEGYLEKKAADVQALGLQAESIVHVGKAAEEVLSVTSEGQADLVIIATHGRSGVSRWRLGSVADKVIRHASCPTLVIGPNVEVSLSPFNLMRILVPLDGSAVGEQALPVARWLSGKTGAGIDLVRVVQPPAMTSEPMMGFYSVDLFTAMEDAANAYLTRIGASVKTREPVRTAVLTGPSADELIRYLQGNPAELVVMTSHGRAGVLRWALGSVADRMLHGPAPVLVIRPVDGGVASRIVSEATGA